MDEQEVNTSNGMIKILSKNNGGNVHFRGVPIPYNCFIS